MDFSKIADGLAGAGFPNAVGDRLISVGKEFPGHVVEAFTFGGPEGLLVLVEGIVSLLGEGAKEIEYLAICRAEPSKERLEDVSGEGSVPALELAECRVIYSQPAQREASPQYVISLQRMELEVMRRLCGAGFRILLSETGALPPGVADEWLDDGLRSDYVSRLQEANAAIVTSPDDASLHEEKGAIQLSRGRYREAAASFGAALLLTPESTTAWRGLGDALLRMGRKESSEAFARAESMMNSPVGRGDRDPLVHLVLELVPPPVKEVKCAGCGGTRVSWIDPDIYRCAGCGRAAVA